MRGVSVDIVLSSRKLSGACKSLKAEKLIAQHAFAQEKGSCAIIERRFNGNPLNFYAARSYFVTIDRRGAPIRRMDDLPGRGKPAQQQPESFPF